MTINSDELVCGDCAGKPVPTVAGEDTLYATCAKCGIVRPCWVVADLGSVPDVQKVWVE
jgi:hypothetical protein